MTIRMYLESHPEIVASLRDRTLLAKDLAARLGVHHNSVSKALSKLNTQVYTGEYRAARKEASVARRERDVHLQQLVQAVLDGRLKVDDAAAQAGCSRDTIWRHVRRKRKEASVSL